MAKKLQGVCKLTGNFGTFVDSHLIPKALTRPEAPGAPFIQAGENKRPERRWSSWYDNSLVIAKGEKVLALLDDWAIATLRANKLVWSGFEGETLDASDWQAVPGRPGSGFREIEAIDPSKLRLFFLSLLWRAAATSRPEFEEVQIPPADLQTLAQMLLAGDSGSLHFYPIELFQLSTKGSTHNLTPIATTKTIPSFPDSTGYEEPIFRFYFDGLIAHIRRAPFDETLTNAKGPIIVGHGPKLALGTMIYEESFQRHNLENTMKAAAINWPKVMARL